MHAYMHTHVHQQTCIHVYIYTYAHTYIYMYVNMHTYIHVYPGHVRSEAQNSLTKIVSPGTGTLEKELEDGSQPEA